MSKNFLTGNDSNPMAEKQWKHIQCLHCGKQGIVTFRLIQIVKGDYRFNTWKKINPQGWNKGRNGYLCPECVIKRLQGV